MLEHFTPEQLQPLCHLRHLVQLQLHEARLDAAGVRLLAPLRLQHLSYGQAELVEDLSALPCGWMALHLDDMSESPRQLTWLPLSGLQTLTLSTLSYSDRLRFELRRQNPVDATAAELHRALSALLRLYPLKQQCLAPISISWDGPAPENGHRVLSGLAPLSGMPWLAL